MILFLFWRNCHSCWSDFPLLHNCYIDIVIIYTPGLIPSLNGPLACCHVKTYHHICIFLYFHIDIFNFIPYYHIMDVYCIFYFVLPHQNAHCIYFFTIFHALILSTTFCFIAFRDIYGILFYVACFQLMMPHAWQYQVLLMFSSGSYKLLFIFKSHCFVLG